jgi:ornithine cyclodeaminase
LSDNGILVIGGKEIEAFLAGREREVADVIGRAYIAHNQGRSFLPHSLFLRFPDNDLDRIIALPAFLGGGFEVAGLKWISSFPGNLKKGIARASAVLILNDTETGRPEVVLESSLISARRTAASAALGARTLLDGESAGQVGLIGTGLINHEISRFLVALCDARRFLVYDLDMERARAFAGSLGEVGAAEAEVAASLEEVLEACPLVSFATTAIRPHVSDLSRCPAGAVLLHISLRDLTAEAILPCDNVVDDVDHATSSAARWRTSWRARLRPGAGTARSPSSARSGSGCSTWRWGRWWRTGCAPPGAGWRSRISFPDQTLFVGAGLSPPLPGRG